MLTRRDIRIGEFMTASPHTIGRGQSLTTAHHLMREHRVRHLPVLDGGNVVGLLSERDLALLEAIPGVNPTNVYVEEAMNPDIFTTVDALRALAQLIRPIS